MLTPTMETSSSYSGRCLCGDVRYEVRPPTLFFAHCHCRWCQGAHGAAFVTWVGAAEDRFALTAGEDRLRWYQSTEQSRRGFCERCGTTMFFASTLCPGEMHVTRTSLEVAAIDREPQLHCFHDQHASWFAVGDELPRFDSTAPGLDKYQTIPSR